MKRQPVVLHELMRTWSVCMKPLPRNSHSRLSLTCPQDLVLCTDKLLLCRVLANLVDNACKLHATRRSHRDRGGIDKSTGICICVSDSGPGILPKDAERIFERFFPW